jgi:ABC-2 type transport system permease protein
MRNTLLILVNEIVTTIRRPSFLFTLFGLPLVAALIFGIIGFLGRNQSGQVESFFSPAVDTLPTGYLDKSGIITQPGDDPQLVKYESEELIREDLASGKISGYIVIPEDYIVNGSLDYVKTDFNPLSAFEQAGKFQDLLTKNLLVDDPETAERYINPLNIELINKNPDPKQAQESTASLLIPTAITVLFYIILVSSATLLLHSITKEKENRVMEMLMSSVTSRQILTGKIIALGLVGLLQTGVWLGSGLLLMGTGRQMNMLPDVIDIPTSFMIWSLIFFLGGYLLYASLMAGVGAMVPNLREASQATTLVIMPMIVPLVMMNNLIQSPDGALAMTLSFIPFTAPVAMLTRMAVVTVPWWQVAISAILLILFAIWVIQVISNLFRSQVILSGQPFSNKRFIKALFGTVE